MSKNSRTNAVSISKVVYRCDVCSETFETKKELLKHLEEAHSSAFIITYTCPFCGMALKNQASQKKHILECLKETGVSMTSSKAIDQEKILLKIINKIFKVINKSPIKKLTEFKNINRNILVGEHVDNIMEEMEDEFYKVFSKADCGFYRKKTLNNYLFCALKAAVKAIGYRLQPKKKDLKIKNKWTSTSIYSIVKK